MKAPTHQQSLNYWKRWIVNQPSQQPTGVRFNIKGLVHLPDLCNHLAITRLGPGRTCELKGNRKQPTNYLGAAFYRAIVWLIGKGPVYYAEQLV
jgi:hypothetical protein